MEITWVFIERKRGQVEREGVGKDQRYNSVGRERGKRKKRGWPYRRLLPPTDTQVLTGLFPGSPEKGGLELGPTRNQNQSSSSLPRGSVSNPQLRLRPFDQTPASRTGGLEK